jgi:hypothetical protein
VLAAQRDEGVIRYDADGRELASWPLPRPLAVASLPDGSFVATVDVGASEKNVRFFRADGTPLQSWRSAYRMQQVAVDGDGNVYAPVNRGRGLVGFIVKYSAEGQRQTAWGRWTGSAPGQFGTDGPGGVAFDGGVLWTADPDNRRVQAFTPEGEVVRVCSLPPSGTFSGSPIELASTGAGRFYVSELTRLHVYSAEAVAPSPKCEDVAPQPLRLTRARVRPRRFVPAVRRTDPSTGGTVSFTVNRPARVRLAVFRDVVIRTGSCSRTRRPVPARCHRLVSTTAFYVEADGGDNNFLRFPGWTKRHPLAPGSYVLRLRAQDRNGHTATARTSFSIRRPS